MASCGSNCSGSQTGLATDFLGTSTSFVRGRECRLRRLPACSERELTMPGDLSKTGDSIPNRVVVGKPNDVRDWARRFAVTEAEILAAVRAVGDEADDVEAYLQKHRKVGHMNDRALGRL